MHASLLTRRLRLGDLLVQRGYLTDDELSEALLEQDSEGDDRLLGEVLIERGLCSEDQILECLADEIGAPFVRLDGRMFDAKVFETIPRDFIEKNTILPLFRVRETLTVAVAEPTDVFLVDQLREMTGCDVQIAIASPKDIRRTVQTYLPDTRVFVIDDIIDEAGSDAVELIERSFNDISTDIDVADQSPIIRLVNYVIYQAAREGASDIHIEPTATQIRIRYRVDGSLYKVLEPPVHLAPAVASRVKIMANLDISERRLPQDGRIHVMMEGRPIDLRVSTCPMPTGEKIVIRILDNRSVVLSLRELGFSNRVLEPFEQQLAQPNGICLVTGPTGSGKSTTLYAALNAVSSMERNVCTVEDPIEYRLPLINQFQVNDRINLDFASVLRSLLRQDPDVLMVGEIRDRETARVAIQAALTGHLVFSTLHTNDATSTVTRLLDMDVEGYLLGSSLNMVLAQRLCRRICSKCKVAYDPPRVMRRELDKHGLEIETFYKGVGCKRCRQSGYSGRIAIHELLIVDEELRSLIAEDRSLREIREHVRKSGMVPLRHDGLCKVHEGLTTLEEVFRSTDASWVPEGSP